MSQETQAGAGASTGAALPEKLDWTLSDEKLTGKIVEYPDGYPNFGRLLFSLIIGSDGASRDPLRYALIFREAAEKARTLGRTWMELACSVEAVNGWRRDPEADLKDLQDVLAEVRERAMKELKPGAALNQLMGSITYNEAIIARGLREYDHEAQAQWDGAAFFAAAGDYTKVLTQLFAAIVGWATAAFVRGSVEEIRAALQAMVRITKTIRAIVPMEPAWMAQNGHLHRWVWWLWAYLMFPDSFPNPTLPDAYDMAEDDRKRGYETSYPHWSAIFRAWTKLTLGDFVDALLETNKALADVAHLKSSSRDNSALTLSLIKAQAQLALGKKAEAIETLERVARYSGPDGGAPVAVAKAVLARIAAEETAQAGGGSKSVEAKFRKAKREKAAAAKKGRVKPKSKAGKKGGKKGRR